MMKLMLPSTIMMTNNNQLLPMTIMNITLITMMMKLMMSKKMIMNSMFYMDQLSFTLMFLSLMSITLIIMSSKNLKLIMPTLFMIHILLLMALSMNNSFNFYVMFEVILIPTMILITKTGKQPERLQAGMYLIIYTLTASLPLLSCIMYMKNNMSFTMMFTLMYKFNLMMLMIMAFLVKMPMYFFHLWLPKAHVEAPLEGSMVLAAILLKLGGYGLLRFMPMLIQKSFKLNPWIISISMIGATTTSLNCIRQKDLKSLIAYSSVAHMAFTLMSIMSLNYIGLMGAIMMMMAHGLTSSAMFLLVDDLYTKLHSRNIMLFKGMLKTFPNITFWWFIFIAMNISAPPSINTLSEILIMTSIISWNNKMIIPIMLMSLTMASFSLSLFINIIHNKNKSMNSSPSKNKIFLSLFSHLMPLLMMLMKLEIMI